MAIDLLTFRCFRFACPVRPAVNHPLGMFFLSLAQVCDHGVQIVMVRLRVRVAIAPHLGDYLVFGCVLRVGILQLRLRMGKAGFRFDR